MDKNKQYLGATLIYKHDTFTVGRSINSWGRVDIKRQNHSIGTWAYDRLHEVATKGPYTIILSKNELLKRYFQ